MGKQDIPNDLVNTPRGRLIECIMHRDKEANGKFSYRKISQAAKLGENYVSQLFDYTKKSQPKISQIQSLCKVLGLCTAYIVAGTGPKFLENRADKSTNEMDEAWLSMATVKDGVLQLDAEKIASDLSTKTVDMNLLESATELVFKRLAEKNEIILPSTSDEGVKQIATKVAQHIGEAYLLLEKLDK